MSGRESEGLPSTARVVVKVGTSSLVGADGRIRPRAANRRPLALGIVDDELSDEGRVAGQWIADEILADAQPDGDNRTGIWQERPGLNPHVVGQQWGLAHA